MSYTPVYPPGHARLHHRCILFKGGALADSSDVLAHAIQQTTSVVITAGTGDNRTLANVQLASLVADDFLSLRG